MELPDLTMRLAHPWALAGLLFLPVLLARYLLKRYAEEFGTKVKGFTPGAVIALKKHTWPGNVRELENKIKKAVILCDGSMLGPGDLDLTDDALPDILPLAEAREIIGFWQRYVRAISDNTGYSRSWLPKRVLFTAGAQPAWFDKRRERLRRSLSRSASTCDSDTWYRAATWVTMAAWREAPGPTQGSVSSWRCERHISGLGRKVVIDATITFTFCASLGSLSLSASCRTKALLGSGNRS